MGANRTGRRLAASAAALFVAGGCGSDRPDAGSGADVAEVQCQGANACKGQSECATAHSECTGLNACKGKGWVTLTPEACAEAGGTPRTG